VSWHKGRSVLAHATHEDRSDRRPTPAQGFTLEDVKNLLGHSSIVLTSNTYGHVLEQRQREVAMAMDAVLGG
jgi:integrase